MRARRLLIGAQATASALLLVLALILTRATVNGERIDVGFAAEKLVTFELGLTNHDYDASRVTAFWTAALAAVRELPQARAAAPVFNPPFGDRSRVTMMTRHGRRYTVHLNEVGADYFETIGVPVMRGRTFTAEEARAGAPVVVISEAVAEEFWSGEDPIGRPFDRITNETPAPRIIGIVGNAAIARLRDPDRAMVYTPIEARTLRSAALVVRAKESPQAVVQLVQATLRGIDSKLRPTATLVSEAVDRQREEPRAIAALARAVGGIALSLALIGIYGVAAFTVSQRVVEIGVRMAIGATLRDVLVMLLRDTLRPVAIGLVLGVALAVLVAHTVLRNGDILSGIALYDPVALVSAVALLAITATLAVLIPARRAARVDPASVLRS